MIKCPFEPEGEIVEAELVGREMDEEIGYEVSIFLCTNGHTWRRPSRRFLLYSMAYGETWLSRIFRR